MGLVATLMLGRTFSPFVVSGHQPRRVERIAVVVAGPNPSYDYYLAPRLALPGAPTFEVFDLSRPPPQSLRLQGTLVLFCRYMTRPWLRLVEAERKNLAGVALFIDDDMDALFADATVPLWYRARLYRLALAHRKRLRGLLDVLFVANERLADRHRNTRPIVLPPAASETGPNTCRSGADIKLAFHSTSVHAAEHHWLRPVISRVLAAEPRVSFEVIAGGMLAMMWRGLPRTSIVAPMRWPDYRAHAAANGADLLLAPLLPSSANAARSATKRIDAARLGAALLVSDAAVYRPDPEEQALGMCLPGNVDAWIAGIRALANNPSRLSQLRSKNREQVKRFLAGVVPLVSDDAIVKLA